MMRAPKGWRVMRMGEAGEIDGGRQRSPHLTDGKLRPYLRVANVMDGYIDVSDVKEMKFTEAAFEQYRLRVGDILLNEGQSMELCGRPAIYRGNPPDCCFQNTLIRFRPGDAIGGLFALQLFKFLLASRRFANIASKTTSIAHLGVSRFAGLQAAFPPLLEQRQIALFLTACDHGIELQQTLLAAELRQKRGLMQQLTTGRRRFKEFVKSATKVKTRYGDFPDDWSQFHMGDIADDVGVKNGGAEELPVLSCTKHRGLVQKLLTGEIRVKVESKK
jgi:type I restriction enzyme S subunit